MEPKKQCPVCGTTSKTLWGVFDCLCKATLLHSGIKEDEFSNKAWFKVFEVMFKKQRLSSSWPPINLYPG